MAHQLSTEQRLRNQSVIEEAVELERIVRRTFQVHGNGLGGTFRKAEARMPSQLFELLDQITRIRNRVKNKLATEALPEASPFFELVAEAKRSLEAVGRVLVEDPVSVRLVNIQGEGDLTRSATNESILQGDGFSFGNLWDIRQTTSNTMVIVSRFDFRVLACIESMPGRWKLAFEDYSGEGHQNWQLHSITLNAFVLVSAHTGHALDSWYDEEARCWRVHLWDRHDGANQQWQLIPVLR